MFQRAKWNRAFEDVISQIQEAILQGGLKEGEKLPGERKLSEMFAVSRGTVRLVAAEAAQRPSKGDLDQLYNYVDSIRGYQHANQFNWPEMIRTDSQFHLYLARMAG
jgi:DNA-binding FadR family transcriptional regulator